MLQVLTANRLIDGAVVYLATNGAWVEALDGARVFDSKADAEAALQVGVEAERRLVIVHAYLFDVVQAGDRVKPVKQREVIRAAGPTVRRDLGKQAVALCIGMTNSTSVPSTNAWRSLQARWHGGFRVS
jgi:hypothetical protein